MKTRKLLFSLLALSVIMACGVQLPPVTTTIRPCHSDYCRFRAERPVTEPGRIIPALTSDRGGEMQKWRVVP